jgi:hypothetical protein
LLQPGEVFYDQENNITITANSQSSDGKSMGFTVATGTGVPPVPSEEPPPVPSEEPPPVVNIEPPPVTLAISTGKRDRQILRWSSVDTSKVSHYEVIRNGVTIATSTSTAYEDRSVSKGNSYSYIVVAVSTAGLRSEDSNIVTVDLTATTTTKNNRGRKNR